MPPEDTGINFAITFKQFVMGVISICGTVIGTAWFVMSSYMPTTAHQPWEQKISKLHDEAVMTKAYEDGIEELKEDHDQSYNKLKNDIEKGQEEQLKLRRNILKSVDIEELTDLQKNELRQIEEIMLNKGYLNPALRTDAVH